MASCFFGWSEAAQDLFSFILLLLCFPSAPLVHNFLISPPPLFSIFTFRPLIWLPVIAKPICFASIKRHRRRFGAKTVNWAHDSHLGLWIRRGDVAVSGVG